MTRAPMLTYPLQRQHHVGASHKISRGMNLQSALTTTCKTPRKIGVLRATLVPRRPHPSSQNRDSRPPSPRHNLNDHKRQAYTAAEKLKWVAQLDVAVSVRALARESGIHRMCLANWKRAADFLKEAHSVRCCMHGRGRASWYRPMEIKVCERLLDWQRKGNAVSVGRMQEWSREFMKILYPLVKWKGSQRWSDRFHVAEQCKKFWQFVCDKRRECGIETVWIINADQTPLWLEMPATTTIDQTDVWSVPIRSAGYQKERVTVMLACMADGMKLKLWVFFKRETVPKGVFPPGENLSCSCLVPLNGIAGRRIGMVMDVARTSMIHAAAPHFLWPFAVRYAAHQINLQPRVSLPETTPTLRRTGKVGDASAFRVWGSRAFVRDTTADKLSSRAVPCVFLGFPPDLPLPPPPSPLFLAPGTPPVDPLPPQGPAPSGVSQVDPVEPVEVAVDLGAESGGAEPAGAGTGVAESGGAESGRAVL
ncbi:unnamed protein product [Closterium sp. NIES-53]